MKSIFCFLLLFIPGTYAFPQNQLNFNPNTPPGFLPNKGQVRDLNHNRVNDVYYQANLGGQQVFLTKNGLSIVFTHIKSSFPEAILQPAIQQQHDARDSVSTARIEMERIDITLKNASIHPQNIVSSENPASPDFHFYIDDNTSATTRLLDELLVKNVYPGIDWRLYIRNEPGKIPHLKYDFIVHPGADLSKISLQYSPNAQLTLQNNEITAQTRMGTINEEKPYAFTQETESEVPVTYSLQRNTIRFEANAFDKNQTLVIDPSIFWMTYLTSSGTVYYLQAVSGNDIETDDQGNIFVQLSGATYARFPTINPGNGAYYQDLNASPKGAMILIKFSPGGKMLWSTYFGNGVRGRLMTRSKTGELFALGVTYDGTPSDPNPNPSIPLLNNNGFYNGTRKKNFITRFSNDGKLLWSSYYANFDTYPIDMTWDVNGNIYVTGWSTNYDFPTVNPGDGAYMANPSSGLGYAQTLFVSQFNDQNQLTWSTRIEGNDYDPHARICTDKKGNIYIGGQNRSANYPLKNAGGYFNNTSPGSVLIRFNPARQITWCTFLPGAFQLSDVTTDENSNLYVTIGNRIVKFDADTRMIFDKKVPTTQMHFWNRIVYDERNRELQLLGVMNDGYWGFPTLNTACNGSFFHDGTFPRKYYNSTGPIFSTMDTDGNFTYRSLVDWVYEYYDYNEMTLDAEGNMIYLFFDQRNAFQNPNPQLTNPGNGAYFDGTCCYQSASMSALLLKLNRSELAVSIQTTAATNCEANGTATITPQCGLPPFSYLWSTGATTDQVADLRPGYYWVRITDAQNLTKTINVQIPLPPGTVTNITKSVSFENCDRSNGSIRIESVIGGTAPYLYSINGSSFQSAATFTDLKKDRYILQVKDANGCLHSDTTDLQRIDGPQDAIVSTTPASCIAADGELTVSSVTGGVAPYSYALNSGLPVAGNLFTGLSASAHQLTIIDAAGCKLSKSVSIEQSLPPTEAVISASPEHCQQKNGSILVGQITGGKAPYSWSLDQQAYNNLAFSGLSSGSYDVFIRDANGCVLKKAAVSVPHVDGPSAFTTQVEDAFCGKTRGSLRVVSVMGGTLPVQYALDNGPFGTAAQFNNVTPGNHTLQVKDVNGCILSNNVTIQFKKQATFSIFPADTTLCYGETLPLQLNGELNRLKNISWNIPGQGTSASLFIAESRKNVVVMAADEDNCPVQAQAVVQAKACNPPEKCIAIPTAFTPNGDGKNDVAMPIVNGCNIRSIKFQIFNRFGELVFQTDKLGVGWNGMIRSEEQNGGVFISVCEYTTSDDVTIRQKQTLVLIR